MEVRNVSIKYKVINNVINSGRKINVFLRGDYEFLTRMYGLSGASGKHY